MTDCSWSSSEQTLTTEGIDLFDFLDNVYRISRRSTVIRRVLESP